MPRRHIVMPARAHSRAHAHTAHPHTGSHVCTYVRTRVCQPMAAAALCGPPGMALLGLNSQSCYLISYVGWGWVQLMREEYGTLSLASEGVKVFGDAVG